VFSFREQSIQVWGVANATPDSFSDGGDLSTSEKLRQKFEQWNCDGIDVGAESTNPKAKPITDADEQERLTKVLLPLLSTWPKQTVLSIDSYRIKTLEWLLPLIPTHVGVIEEAAEILKRHPRLGYVLCHNPVPRRELAALHMQSPLVGDAVSTVTAFFREQADVFIRAGVFDRCWADPCFGFGKSREQNHALMKALPEMMEDLPYPKWVWGVSRKSFLRFPASLDPKDPQVQTELDGLQLLWAAVALEKLRTPHVIAIRAHAPHTLKALASWPSLNLPLSDG
jgi:dihydropteroate synthase